jgi:excisionase family DNA binding protein
MASGTSGAAPPVFYSIKELADSLGVSTRTIRRWIKAEKLRAHRFGHVRIAHDDLEDFIARHVIQRNGDRRPDLSRPVSALENVGKTPNK